MANPTPEAECLYCQKNENKLMVKICDLEISQLFLFREQSHPGRCNVVFRDHGVDFHELTSDQRDAFMRDVTAAGRAIASVCSPERINYGAYGDKISHLHFHIVPKYKDGFGFGGVFEMNPQKTFLSESEYAALAEKIKSAL